MKKRIFIPIAALLCLTVLAGCKTLAKTNVLFGAESFSKAQRIVIRDAGGNEKAVLTEKEEIDAFVDAVNTGGWKLEELPEGLTEAGSFTLWQTETLTALFGEGEEKVNEICTFRLYRDGDYLTVETALVNITFSIPKAAADYLRDLAA